MLRRITLDATPAGQPVLAALTYLCPVEDWTKARLSNAPTAFIGSAWKRHALDGTGGVTDNRAYVFTVLEGFRAGLKRRDLFVPSSVRYADPRRGLLGGEAWNATRPTICRALDRSPDGETEVANLAARLDRAWHQVAANLPSNSAARIERRNERDELVLSPLDKIEQPPSLIALHAAIAARMPRIGAIHAGPNPKYFGAGRGITYYNLLSDQFTGLNAVVVPGTLRDSLLILGLLLEQETDLEPVEIMTDTAAYTDTVFGLFWLLGYQFSPRLADIGDARFWRIDRTAHYGALDDLARHRIDTELITRN